MKFPIFLAHGQGLISLLFLTVTLGVVFVCALVAATVNDFKRGKAGERTTCLFIGIALACPVLWVIGAPVAIRWLHLP